MTFRLARSPQADGLAGAVTSLGSARGLRFYDGARPQPAVNTDDGEAFPVGIRQESK